MRRRSNHGLGVGDRLRVEAWPDRRQLTSRTEATMKLHIPGRWLALVIIGVGLGVGQGMAQTMGSLFQMMGGMDTVTKLSSNVLQSAAKDPRLAGVLGKVDTNSMSPKLADQMCSMLGGSCKAPLTDQQITAGSSKLDA